MPTNRFATNALQGATPGLSRLAAALGGGQSAYEAGADRETSRQTKMAQALAQIDAAKASARNHDASARQSDAETSILSGRQGLGEEQVAFGAGTDIPTVRAIRDMVRTGQAPQVPMGPPAEDGSMGRGSQQFDPELRSKVAQSLQTQIPLLTNLKDLDPEKLAKARGLDRNSALSDAIMAGNADRNRVAGAQAAVEAKPLFHVSGDGGVLDQYSGGLNESGGLAQSTIGLKKAQTGAQNANAVQSYASAENSRASAGKTRQEMAQGGKTGNIQVVTDGSGNITLLDKATGVARGAIGPDGLPLQGKGGSLNQEQANALTFATRMRASQGILDDMASQGVYRPSLTKQTLEGVPLVGGALGAGANALMASPQQQQVEQAQRDFINAVLRRESGAAISSGEFANAAQQYFDQPGDAGPVKAQKRASRERVIQGMLAAVPPNQRALPALPGAATPAAPGAPMRNVTVDY